jgi:hypothetical protein
VSAILAVLSAPAFADGTGSATLMLPLLQWCAQARPPIISTAVRDGPGHTASALCRLLAGLGDHSTTYVTENLVQAFLRTLPPSLVDTASTRRRASGCSASGICFKKHFGRSSSYQRLKSRVRRGCGLLQRLSTLSWSLHLGPMSAGLLPQLGGQKVRGYPPLQVSEGKQRLEFADQVEKFQV